MTGLLPLTARVVVGGVRDRELFIALLLPVVLYAGFIFVLRDVIDTGGMSYAQYVLPAVLVQATMVGTVNTLDRAAAEERSGFAFRLATLPIATATPLLARMLYCLLRGALALLVTVAVAYAFGFRLTGGLWGGVGFVALTLLLTLVLSLAADAAGTWRCHSNDAGQFLLLPQLLLVMLSTGMAPVSAFPDWAQPFVRHQPVSRITDALRGLATGDVDTGAVAAGLAWCLPLLVLFGAVALRLQGRQR
ncbi:ABC transporter permease [uncultured Mycolicibacterium sp.]|uniref:ABC transporter permease n=1 Tax=uncultured Mycolicibacterium sp. TaxID=2320817 RepID=UPI0026035327|nr:ABC transporter permease [uncultured Mycolicibacterium sp.]